MLKILFIFLIVLVYLLFGFIFDIIQGKYITKSSYDNNGTYCYDINTHVIVFWPFCAVLLLVFLPFYLVAKLFKVL